MERVRPTCAKVKRREMLLWRGDLVHSGGLAGGLRAHAFLLMQPRQGGVLDRVHPTIDSYYDKKAGIRYHDMISMEGLEGIPKSWE